MLSYRPEHYAFDLLHLAILNYIDDCKYSNLHILTDITTIDRYNTVILLAKAKNDPHMIYNSKTYYDEWNVYNIEQQDISYDIVCSHLTLLLKHHSKAEQYKDDLLYRLINEFDFKIYDVLKCIILTNNIYMLNKIYERCRTKLFNFISDNNILWNDLLNSINKDLQKDIHTMFLFIIYDYTISKKQVNNN